MKEINKEEFKKEGLEVEVKVFDDYVRQSRKLTSNSCFRQFHMR